MAANQIQDLEKLLATIPKHLLSVDWKGLREWSNTGNKTKDDKAPKREVIVDNVALVSIPSINEFERLLYQISPAPPKEAYFDESDLITLKVSKDLAIIFQEAAKQPKDKDKRVNKETTDDETSKKSKETAKTTIEDNAVTLVLPKLVYNPSEESKNDSETVLESNTLLMSCNDEFNCLLVGAGCAAYLSRQHLQDENMENVILDFIFTNISKYFRKSSIGQDIDSCKDEIKPIWSLIVNLLNWKTNDNGNWNEQIWIVRLAMILCVSSENITQLSFVADYLRQNEDGAKERKNETKSDNDEDTVVTGQDSHVAGAQNGLTQAAG